MIPDRYSVAILMIGLFLGTAATPVRPASAQQVTPEQLQRLMRDQGNSTPGGGSPAPTQDLAASGTDGPLLDRSINRAEYRLGAGDRLILSLFGYQSQVIPLTVTPEGSIIVPSVGIVRVGGLNLNEATAVTRRRVLTVYPDYEVDLSLSGIRSFKIFLVGGVPKPGPVAVTAVTRVSEVISQADSTRFSSDVILRNVRIRRGSDTINVDLAKFRQTGDVRFNPFLLQGDIVEVPIIDQTITIAGEVPFPGKYEYRAGETLAELLRFVNGGSGFLTRAADTLVLMRFTRDPRGEIIPIARNDSVAQQMLVRPFDAIYVPRMSRYMRGADATIQGEVARPGTYPIRPDVTTVRDLVAMAGGFTESASRAEVLLRRDASLLPEAPNPLEMIPPEYLSPDERRILQVTSTSDENSVIIDVSPTSEAFNLPLEGSDVLLVPRRREEVTVLGAVARPGLVLHAHGISIDDFVERAGGYVRRADRGDVVILRSRSGTQLHRRDVDRIQPGDRIVVPFRQHTTLMERVQTAQGVIGTISGLVLSIVGMERLWDAITN